MTAKLTVYVTTPDVERLSRFYQQALGVTPGDRQGNWVPFAVGGATFALHAAAPGDDPARVNVSFSVDDVAAAVRAFDDGGAKVLRGVADETFGRMATLEDPDGRTFEVVQYA